jgi:plastocyanin
MKYLLILVLLLSMILTSCKDDVTEPGDNSPPANQVWMLNNAFVPPVLTVQSGTTVTWVNREGVLHTVTSSSAELFFDSGNLSRDQSYSFNFDSTGAFTYYCRLHPEMTGTIIVQ